MFITLLKMVQFIVEIPYISLPVLTRSSPSLLIVMWFISLYLFLVYRPMVQIYNCLIIPASPFLCWHLQSIFSLLSLWAHCLLRLCRSEARKYLFLAGRAQGLREEHFSQRKPRLSPFLVVDPQTSCLNFIPKVLINE